MEIAQSGSKSLGSVTSWPSRPKQDLSHALWVSRFCLGNGQSHKRRPKEEMENANFFESTNRSEWRNVERSLLRWVFPTG